jgi:hypothetical protein
MTRLVFAADTEADIGDTLYCQTLQSALTAPFPFSAMNACGSSYRI